MAFIESSENHDIFPSFFRVLWSRPLGLRAMRSRLFSLKLIFEHSKSESLCYVIITRIGETLPCGFPQTASVVLSILSKKLYRVSSDTACTF